MPPVIQMTRRGAVSNDADRDALHRTFARQHCAKLAGFLEPSLLDDARALITRGTFRDFAHDDLATELRLDDGVCTGFLHFLTNDRQLFQLVESVSGCERIRSFSGRVYRRYPGGHHYDNWHGDVDGTRLIGMSVNLSTDVYQGGEFQIREVETERDIASLPNLGFGDAILFRLSSALEHRVTDPLGTFPKTAFAGWFLNDLDFEQELRAIAIG